MLFADLKGSLELIADRDPEEARRLLDRYRVTSGKGFRLKDRDPADTAGHLVPRGEADARLALGVEHLAALQEKL